MDRRRFLLTLAAGLAGASLVHGAGELGDLERVPARAPRPEPAASLTPPAPRPSSSLRPVSSTPSPALGTPWR